jgi:hypothetical protein
LKIQITAKHHFKKNKKINWFLQENHRSFEIFEITGPAIL